MWTVTISNDTDNPEIGTITATHSDGFTISGRAEHKGSGIEQGFLREAILARRAAAAKRATIAAIEARLSAKMNAADPS